MIIRWFYILIFLCVVTLQFPAFAQGNNNDDVVTDRKTLDSVPEPESELQRALKEIHEEPEKVDEAQKTGKEYANEHFMKCIAVNKPHYTTEIQEYMCACTASKISQFLSPDEIKIMPEETKKGEAARLKYIIHAHTPCMKDAIKEISFNACKTSSFLKKNMITGKKKVCDCVVSGMQELLNNIDTRIVTSALITEPTTLDPLHYFMGTNEYLSTTDSYIRNCYNANVQKK